MNKWLDDELKKIKNHNLSSYNPVNIIRDIENLLKEMNCHNCQYLERKDKDGYTKYCPFTHHPNNDFSCCWFEPKESL